MRRGKKRLNESLSDMAKLEGEFELDDVAELDKKGETLGEAEG